MSKETRKVQDTLRYEEWLKRNRSELYLTWLRKWEKKP